jgi:hypothetical protein
MHQTLVELVQGLACVFAFALFLLPPGFLFARLIDLNNMRSRSREEQLLWATVVSLPLALVLSQLLGRVLPPNGVLLIYGVMALASLALLAITPRTPQAALTPAMRRGTYAAYLAAAFWCAYALFATATIRIGDRLFVPTTISDWAVRVPMVASAIRGPVPPLNPLSALHGVAQLRYYYYWYVLTAEPARLLHLPPQAALAASCVWAGFALLAVIFLCLKYLCGERSLRRRILFILVPLVTIGLDILPTALIFLRHSHPRLDMEWWRIDRTPAFLTTLLYAPHHIGGLVCCLFAFLVLVEVSNATASGKPSILFLAGRALLIGIAFAACAGTSTFLAFIFVIVCVVWSADLLRTKQFRPLILLAAAGVIAWALSRPFLHEMGSGTSAAQGFAAYAWRSAQIVRALFKAKHILLHHPVMSSIAQQPLVLLMDFFELGFFFFVLVDRFRHELLASLRGRISMQPGQRALWAILIGAGLCALFVSSAVTQSANDLGMHAGIVVRFVLVLWAVPFVQRVWSAHRNVYALTLAQKIMVVGAVQCLILGFIGGLWGLAMNRLYFPLMEAHIFHPPSEQLTADHLGQRLFAIQSAWQTLDRSLPPNARTQFNPSGLMAPAMSFFSDRQIVAADGGCGTAFGGDFTRCLPVNLALHHLFGTQPFSTQVDGFDRFPPSLSLASAGDFAQVCNGLSLDAVLVDSTDPVWQQPNSWVWTLTPEIAYPTLRVFSCDRSTSKVHETSTP